MKVPINETRAREILHHFPDPVMKYLYVEPKSKQVSRKILSRGNIVYDVKTLLWKRSQLMCYRGMYIDVDHKSSEETLLREPIEKDWNVAIVRHVRQWKSLRWSIENYKYIHCESEKAITLQDFRMELEIDPFTEFCLKLTFVKTLSIERLLGENINLARKFGYKNQKDEKYVYHAPKLDGIRHMFILYGKSLIFPFDGINKTIPKELNNNQIFVGNAECVNNEMFIIDVCQIYGPTGLYANVSIMDSISIMFHLSSIGVLCNTFYKTPDEAFEVCNGNPQMYDGILSFSPEMICKRKICNTVDLLYKKTRQSFVLEFDNEQIFSELCPEYKVVVPNIEMNAIVLEFKIEPKKLTFVRVRHDKIVANTFETFKEMCK